MINLIWFLLVGLIAGWLAGRVMQRGFGLIGNLVIGVLGAIIGGYLFGLLNLSIGGGILGSIVVAFVGAVVLIFVLSLLKR